MASLCVAVLLTEIGLRAFYEQLPPGAQEVLRDVKTWLADDKVLGPSWFETCVGDKYYSAKILPNLDRARVKFGPAVYHLSTSDLGFKGVGFRSQPAASYDGVVVGDSFGFCHHVEIEDCWVRQVEVKSEIKIANLSIPATGSTSHSRYLEKFGRRLKPRFVIWQYWVNDPREDVQHILGGGMPCALPKNVQEEISNAGKTNVRSVFKEHSALANLLYRAWENHRTSNEFAKIRNDVYEFTTSDGQNLFAWRGEGSISDSDTARVGFEMSTAAIGLAARRTQATGGQFLLLIAPSNLQVHADNLPDEILRSEMRYENDMSDRLVEFAKTNGIEYIDLRNLFIDASEQGAKLYPEYDVHWTPHGNRLAADAVSDWLAAHGLSAR